MARFDLAAPFTDPLPATLSHQQVLALFDRWLAEAGAREVNDPNAMALATVDPEGWPSLRTVLLKGHDARGFVFYTNFEGRKGRELLAQPRAALLFHWKSLLRQVRIEGPVESVSDAEADAYYASRSRLSQIGAWASDQSRPLVSRAELAARVADYDAKFAGLERLPRPVHWSGFRVKPHRMEFWQDGAGRLHDRFLLTPAQNDDGWRVQRLYP